MQDTEMLRINRIRELYRTTELDYDDLCERFNGTKKSIQSICRGVTKKLPRGSFRGSYRPKGYTDDEYELWRFFQGLDIDHGNNMTNDGV